MCDISNPVFHDEEKARKHLEALRWPSGPVCPFCGGLDKIKAVPADAMKTKAGKPRKGWYHCNDCRKKFTIRVGSIFERSHVPLHKWLMAFHLMAASKKGMSAHQLHRMLAVTYKTAWFMAHRIRECMKPGKDEPPMGGEGKTVEADETYIGNRKGSRLRSVFVTGKGWTRRGTGHANQYKIISLVERGGRARSVHVRSLTANTARDVLVRNVDRKSALMTDESNIYKMVGTEYASHESVNHSAHEYGRGIVSTNTIEGFFSIFKRGMRGVYQHCSEAHLHRYLAEFDFRYSNRKISDAARALTAIKGSEGKRLTYRRTDEARFA